MKVYKLGSRFEGLEPSTVLKDWGAVCHGPEPRDHARVDTEEAAGPVTVGVWAVECGEFDLTYACTEFVTFVEGRLTVSQSDQRHELGPGDSLFVRRGETVRWTVTEAVKKVFVAID